MKAIVDSSVWVGHFRKADAGLVHLLERGDVLMHPAVIGELACGGLKNRIPVLADLKVLPRPQEAGFEEILELIENSKLHGKGLGWVDCELLASALVTGATLYTHDRALADAAAREGMGRR